MNVVVRRFEQVAYAESLAAMREFVDSRGAETSDEIWFLEHPSVFTQGQGGRSVHVHDTGDIPVVQSDRGGQVTYHGPGQLIAYILMDLHREGIGPRELVRRIEAAVIATLEDLGIAALRRAGAPGVYVEEAKIAALGLRIRRGMSYHGLSFNVNVDLEPFSRIDPCGYQGLRVTRLQDHGIEIDRDAAADRLLPHLILSLYGVDAGVSVEDRAPDECSKRLKTGSKSIRDYAEIARGSV
jgi:lipoyl(octanoyl) transferase